jgi:DNA mismatch repair protein MutL
MISAIRRALAGAGRPGDDDGRRGDDRRLPSGRRAAIRGPATGFRAAPGQRRPALGQPAARSRERLCRGTPGRTRRLCAVGSASGRDRSAASGGTAHPLGAARAQIHENYIVAQTGDSLVIVDQHAAHERLVFEALKTALAERALPSQMLLVPDVIDLPVEDVDRLVAQGETLARFGLEIERFGPGAVAVRATPAMLGEVDTQGLIRDLADDLGEGHGALRIRDNIEKVASTMACHGSVRSGGGCAARR